VLKGIAPEEKAAQTKNIAVTKTIAIALETQKNSRFFVVAILQLLCRLLL
jgi:hypothetical protein